MMSKSHKKYKEAIASYLGIKNHQVFLFWKGRVAFYSLLKAFGIGENDEVIIPGFTCVVVPNAIIYLGAKPIYVDIDASTYNVNTSLIESKITKNTKAIVAQNTFGLAPDLDELRKLADKFKLILIEDCTHGFGGTYKSKLNGLQADASFFSTQWNKPYSTGIGGFAVVNDEKLITPMKNLEAHAQKPSLKDEPVLWILLKIYPLVKTPFIFWPALKLYRYLSDKNLVIGSSQGEELEGTDLPEGYFKGMSHIQAKKGVTKIADVDSLNKNRKEVAKLYGHIFSSLNIAPPFQPVYSEHTFLKYPVLVNDRAGFIKMAEKEKVELGEWFLSPLHPIKDGWEKWLYVKGSCPVAEEISERIVNLPTDMHVKSQKMKRLLTFIQHNKSSFFKKY